MKSYSLTTYFETESQLQKEHWKNHKYVKIKEHATEPHWVKEEIKDQKIHKDKREWHNDVSKSLGCNSGIIGLPQWTRKILVNNLTFHLKELEKEEQTKPKVSIRKKIIKIRELK